MKWLDCIHNGMSITKYLVSDGKKHPFAVILPGGGYSIVANWVEGKPYAKAFNAHGIHAFVVYYRVRGKAEYPNPLDDVANAVKEILSKAEEYNLDINNYSIIGSSAGGHLAGMYARSDIGYLKYNLPKPNTLILVYPVVTLTNPTHEDTKRQILGKNKNLLNFLSLEQNIKEDFPKTFLWCGDSDRVVDSSNSLKLDKALTEKKINHIFHLYPGLDHGIGLAKGTVAEGWLDEAIQYWLK